MSIARFCICLILCIFPLLIFAQDSDEVSKTKQQRQTVLVEQIIADIPNLKLGENRAIVYAKIGGIVWKNDEKRARAFFQNAVGELINAQISAEADKKNRGYHFDLTTGQTTRPQILQTIAARDAELALEYLYKTRPEAVVKALSMPTAKSFKISSNSHNYAYLAQNENNLEQSLVRLVADQNPERAVKLLKESLKKGLSGETLELLKKLHRKDAETADQMVSGIVGKLIGGGFDAQNPQNYQSVNIAVNFLNEFIRERGANEKAIAFDKSQMQNLADKLIAFSLQQNDPYSAYSILSIAEKLSPANVERIKQSWRKLPNRGPMHGGGYDPDVNRLLSNNEMTPDQLITQAKKFSAESRRRIYHTAANKLAQQGDLNRAVEILKDNFDDDALEQEIHNLNSQYSYNLISAGKFAEAESLIDEFPENARVYALINLANAIYQKNPADNKSRAAAVLGKARAFVSEKPEDTTEMSNLTQIISAYGTIEPIEAFRLFEPLIPQINELSEAAVVINGFQRNSNIRQGEFVINNNNSWGFYGTDFSVLSKLSISDFHRVLNLIDSFSRREMRISLKLQLAETILN